MNNSFSKLRALLPDLEYVGNDSEVQMHIHQLQGEMAELLALSQRLSGGDGSMITSPANRNELLAVFSQVAEGFSATGNRIKQYEAR